jgi:AP-3 complex subunit beta
MAALNRLQQRIKENFHETTRDLTLLAAPTAPSSSYFDSAASTTEEKLREISKLLVSRNERERLEGMKRVIAGISRGRDMERFFAEVVKNVVASSIEIRKLVYIYLLRL